MLLRRNNLCYNDEKRLRSNQLRAVGRKATAD